MQNNPSPDVWPINPVVINPTPIVITIPPIVPTRP